MLLNETMLVAEVISGDREAEENFIKIFRPRLFRASVQFLGGPDYQFEADQIVDACFQSAIPQLKSSYQYDFIYPWLRQICLRGCLDFQRSGSHAKGRHAECRIQSS